MARKPATQDPLPEVIEPDEEELEADEALDEGGAEDKPGRQFITALARGLDVLRAFRVKDLPLSNQELARRTGLPRPTISRITYTLTELGFLNYHERFGCYELGGGALVLGHVARSNFDTIEKVRPAMMRMAEKSGANVGFGTRDRLNMIYLETCQGPSRVGLRLEVGSRIPIISTAMGRAYLAAASEEDLRPLLAQLRRKYRDNVDEVTQSVEMARGEINRYGFCISAGDWQDDIHGIAVPISAPELGGVFVVNCGGPSYLLPKRQLINEVGPALVETAQEIATVLGASQNSLETRGDAGTGHRRARRARAAP